MELVKLVSDEQLRRVLLLLDGLPTRISTEIKELLADKTLVVQGTISGIPLDLKLGLQKEIK